MAFRNFPSFVGPNVISECPSNGLSISQLTLIGNNMYSDTSVTCSSLDWLNDSHYLSSRIQAKNVNTNYFSV